MPRYNFHELKGHKLPEDINEPAIKMLTEKLQCPEAVQFVKQFQDNKNCGNIQIFDREKPKHIKLTFNYGICSGWDLGETAQTDRFIISAIKHILNTNVDMRKIKKEV